MAGFICFIIGSLLTLLWIAIIAQAILSWLYAFNVVNPHNRVVGQIAGFLDAATGWLLRPFQRIIPPLGGLDISPIIVLLLIRGVQIYLLPIFCNFLYSLFGA
ncbi:MULTISPECIES: YggT family protein [Brevundimonas]|uniref:YggT family protein n=1 Tax=Brevundimonas TaxID=41275 RepID=UPI000F034CD7|nr:YggT family protein [Brevundimonas lutea]